MPTVHILQSYKDIHGDPLAEYLTDNGLDATAWETSEAKDLIELLKEEEPTDKPVVFIPSIIGPNIDLLEATCMITKAQAGLLSLKNLKKLESNCTFGEQFAKAAATLERPTLVIGYSSELPDNFSALGTEFHRIAGVDKDWMTPENDFPKILDTIKAYYDELHV